ncbi:MAG: hypothetical protein ABEI78_02350, partial [Candidatus Nanohaloarchaea archaeon]
MRKILILFLILSTLTVTVSAKTLQFDGNDLGKFEIIQDGSGAWSITEQNGVLNLTCIGCKDGTKVEIEYNSSTANLSQSVNVSSRFKSASWSSKNNPIISKFTSSTGNLKAAHSLHIRYADYRIFNKSGSLVSTWQERNSSVGTSAGTYYTRYFYSQPTQLDANLKKSYTVPNDISGTGHFRIEARNGAGNISFIIDRITLNGSGWNFNSDSPPVFNSTSVNPDPLEKNTAVNYSAKVYDEDSNISYTNLTVTGICSATDLKRTGTNPQWDKVCSPNTEGWLNATFETVSDTGQTTTKSLDRYLNDSIPEVVLDSPLDGASLSGSTTFKYNATDDYGLNKTTLYISDGFSSINDSSTIGTVYPKTPFSPVLATDVSTNSPVLTASDVTATNSNFVADPFLIPDDEGRLWLFFESDDAGDGHGNTHYARVYKNKTVDYRGIAVNASYHISFPAPVEINNTYYIVHANAKNEFRVWTTDEQSFPTGWTDEGVLFSDTALGDHLLFYRDNRWWAIWGNSDIYIKYSNKTNSTKAGLLNANWNNHPESPVESGTSETNKVGGSWILRDNYIIGTYNNNSGSSNYVQAYNISLNTTNYSSTLIGDVTNPDGSGWNSQNMHHFDPIWGNHRLNWSNRWIAAVDGDTGNNDFKIGLQFSKWSINDSKRDSNPTNGTNSFNYDVSGLGSGHSFWFVGAEDTSSQKTNSSFRTFFTNGADNTAPSIIVHNPPNATISDSSPWLNVTSTEAVNFTRNVEYR